MVSLLGQWSGLCPPPAVLWPDVGRCLGKLADEMMACCHAEVPSLSAPITCLVPGEPLWKRQQLQSHVTGGLLGTAVKACPHTRVLLHGHQRSGPPLLLRIIRRGGLVGKTALPSRGEEHTAAQVDSPGGAAPSQVSAVRGWGGSAGRREDGGRSAAAARWPGPGAPRRSRSREPGKV